MTYYKATRTDGTSFYDSKTKWTVGRITRHPNPNTSKGLCSSGVLHISDAPGETLAGGSWPCRLFEVEPRSALISGVDHMHGCTAVKVVRELPAWQALGPNGEAVAAHIEQCKTITPEQGRQLADARTTWTVNRPAARTAAWDAAAGDAARTAALACVRNVTAAAVVDGAWSSTWDARDAALALVVRDLITPEQFDRLYGPWASVMGPARSAPEDQ